MAARLSLLLFALPSANGIVIPIIHTNTQAHRNAGTSISPILANRKRMTRLPEGPLGLSRLVKNGYVNVRHVNKITWPCPHRLPLVKEKEKKKDEQKFKSTKAKPQLGATIVGRGIQYSAFSFHSFFMASLLLYYLPKIQLKVSRKADENILSGWPEWGQD